MIEDADAARAHDRKCQPRARPRRATYSVPEAGAILGVGRSLAFSAAAAGTLPTIRVGKRLLVPRAALEKLLGGPID
jgi:excisionase family DNA binding protein